MVEQKSSTRESKRTTEQGKRRQHEDEERGSGDANAGSRGGGHRFVSREASVESKLKLSTVGLVQLEEFQRIKGELEEERRREAANTLAVARRRAQAENEGTEEGAAASGPRGGSGPAGVERKRGKAKQKKGGRKQKGALSFGDQEDSDEDDDDNGDDGVAAKRTRKNPGVDTSFLPDKEREEEEARVREELRQRWLRDQEAIKGEAIVITYSYWDGSGHRRQVRCQKGDTIAQFLDKCRTQVPELRGAKADSLVYVKEDLIIPHHYSFYDFIVNKTRGKSGPLFSFDVHDDVRLESDVRVEKDDSHAGKVCERAWYERNKHIFPANRWEVFDPEKNYGSYTIKDSRKKKA
ncbi:hypothetical protein H4S06_005351 [Coemansia sp. BCRC 34490]|nr:hypothetical protein LPJ72_003946 [Coemansia sp. Benny D160-2]KAJ2745312.1 hypothetical protein H4S06_005351 [Coemansia sp. BCRC 34490]